MPDDLLEIAIDCISTGNGSPLLSNDEVVVSALIDLVIQKMMLIIMLHQRVGNHLHMENQLVTIILVMLICEMFF